MSELKYGFHNHLVATLHYQGTFTGNASSRAISAAGKFYLPMEAKIVGIYANATAVGTGGTSTINVLSGSNKVTTSGIALSSGTTSGSNAVILSTYQTAAAGTLISLCENTANAVTVANLSVQVHLRPQVV